MRYLPLSDADRSAMLEKVGASSADELFRDVPEGLLLKEPIDGLPLHASEMAVERELGAMARKNMVAGEVPFFLGCGAYKHHVPATVDHIIQRGEFLTAYTPYQPEIAQGTLQVLFEFQTQVARLYGCDVANASMYDGSTAISLACSGKPWIGPLSRASPGTSRNSSSTEPAPITLSIAERSESLSGR